MCEQLIRMHGSSHLTTVLHQCVAGMYSPACLPACLPLPHCACMCLMPQLIGWMVGANTMLEYLLAASTVVKGFASYFTTLIGACMHCVALHTAIAHTQHAVVTCCYICAASNKAAADVLLALSRPPGCAMSRVAVVFGSCPYQCSVGTPGSRKLPCLS